MPDGNAVSEHYTHGSLLETIATSPQFLNKRTAAQRDKE